MIESLAIAVGTALVTLAGSRWADDRRSLAEERSQIAAELRVQLAEAHRRSNACVTALERAIDVAWQRRDAFWLGEEDDGTLSRVIGDANDALDVLKAQASELLVRSDPTDRSGTAEPMTTILDAGERIMNWLRYHELPFDYDSDVETFLQAEASLLRPQPWLLIQAGVPQASPSALGPWLASVLRRNSRKERRELRRESIRILVNRLTRKSRREQLEAEARRDTILQENRLRLAEEPNSSRSGLPIDGAKFAETTFTDLCILKATIETNVPQGGDAGHGGQTRFALWDEGGFAFGKRHEQNDSVQVEVLGDVEAHILADSLIWAGKHLRAMIKSAPPTPGDPTSEESRGQQAA